MLSIHIYDNQDDMTSKMLDRGPAYFRRRVLKTDPILSKQHRKSAVELLEESKPLYVKSEKVRHQRQLPKNAENLQLGARRSRIVDEGGSSRPPPLPPRRKSVPPCTSRRTSPPSAPAPFATTTSSISSSNSPDGSRMTTAKPINLPTVEDAAPINSQPAAAAVAAAASVARLQPPSHSSSHGKLHYNGMDATKDKPSAAKLTSGSKSENTSPATRRDKVHALMSADEWREARTDTSSDIERASGSSLPKLDDHALAMVKRRVKKAINRSRSDLTKRLSNSSDLSELSARFSRNSADLEKFFNEMGLDRSVLKPMLSAHCASDTNLFESVSSLDSPDIRSLTSDDDDSTQKSEHGLKSTELHVGERTAGQTSIVERNARIIKWLCNVKKATSQEED